MSHFPSTPLDTLYFFYLNLKYPYKSSQNKNNKNLIALNEDTLLSLKVFKTTARNRRTLKKNKKQK